MNNSLLLAFQSQLLNDFLPSAIKTVLLVSVVGGMIVVLAIILHAFLKKWLSPGCLYLLWIVVIVRFALFAVPQSPTSFMNLLQQTPVAPTQDTTQQTQPTSSYLSSLPDGFWSNESVTYQSNAAETTTATNAAPTSTLQAANMLWPSICVIWLAGLAFFGLRLGRGYLEVRRMLRETDGPTAELLDTFARLRKRLNVSQRATLHLTESLTLPAMAGVFRPKVLLPRWCVNELNEQQVELVMAHELVHIRRFDGLVQLLSHLVVIVHWFNPLARIACRFVESCRELSCDCRVIETMNNDDRCCEQTEKLYGTTILDIAERSSKQKTIHPALLGGFLNNNHNLMSERIAMLTTKNSPRKWSKIIVSACFLLLLSIGYTEAQTTDRPDGVIPQPKPMVSITPTIPAPTSKKLPGTLPVTENLTEIQMIRGASIRLMNGDEETLKQFSNVDPNFFALTTQSSSEGQQILLVALAVGETNFQFTDETGDIHEYQIVIGERGPTRIIKGSTQRFKFSKRIPQLLVNNPKIISATPLSPTEVLVTAINNGRATLTVQLEDGQQEVRDILVVPDVRGIQETIGKAFPDAAVKIDATDRAIVLTGSARKEHADQITELVEKLSEVEVVNRMSAPGQMAIKVKLFEVDLKKLSDIELESTNKDLTSITDLLSSDQSNDKNSMATELIDSKNAEILAVIEELSSREGIAKLVTQPTLVAYNNQTTGFIEGGEIPIPKSDSEGNKTIEFRPIGTVIQIKPLIENDTVTLELRIELSEIDPDQPAFDGVPGYRVRRINTGVKMKPGQTIALVGDIATGSEAAESEDDTKTETVILITPRLLND